MQRVASCSRVAARRTTSGNGGRERNQRRFLHTVRSSAAHRRHHNDRRYYHRHDHGRQRQRHLATVAVSASLSTALVVFATQRDSALLERAPLDDRRDDDDDDDDTTVVNWSGTHEVTLPASKLFEPESVEELEKHVKRCRSTNTPTRPLGSALSPNGVAFHQGGMVSLANLDDVVRVDEERMEVTVRAGARVSRVVEDLRARGLTLPNLASIAEQQMGGLVQVGAHGTGAAIPPVDDFVTAYTLVTPDRGTVTLREHEHEDFYAARVGLGAVGVVAEITTRVVPAHRLVERTYVLTRGQAKERLNDLLSAHKHVRYMWIPYQDTVVVVTNDPEDDVDPSVVQRADTETESSRTMSPEERRRRFAPLTDLLRTLRDKEDLDNLDLDNAGFGTLRDELLVSGAGPLDHGHVKECNRAEAEFWRLNEGLRVLPSDQLLQFDCGGQQWVWEVCFPTGTLTENDGTDVEFVERLLRYVEEAGVPAPAPIEQRWSASSRSAMSPARGGPDGLHSWVGIIMYLPPNENEERAALRARVTDAFRTTYCDLVERVGEEVVPGGHCNSHWAKLERPRDEKKLRALRKRLRDRYPVDEFNALRRKYDGRGLLSNDLLNTVLGEDDGE